MVSNIVFHVLGIIIPTEKIIYQVGGLEPWNVMTFHSVWNFIIPHDLHIFQRVGQPPTSIYICMYVYVCVDLDLELFLEIDIGGWINR